MTQPNEWCLKICINDHTKHQGNLKAKNSLQIYFSQKRGGFEINKVLEKRIQLLADYLAKTEILELGCFRRAKFLQWDAPISRKYSLPVMNGSLKMLCPKRGERAFNETRIVVGLKSDNFSREMLLRVLHLMVGRADSVLAVHVQHSHDSFDPNTFHIHEDLCKSKEVDFEVKICNGSCYITELSHQVRLTFATILAVGCSSDSPRDSTVTKLLKSLPPTCKLLIFDNGGKILFQQMGTSQQGSISRIHSTLKSSLSESSCSSQPRTTPLVRKSFSMPSPSTPSTSSQQSETAQEFISPKTSHRLAMLEMKGYSRHFMFEQIIHATDNFSTNMLIEEGKRARVYTAVLENGEAVAVKVLKNSHYCEDFFFREVEILSGLRHENIVQLLGFCCCSEVFAVVYNIFDSSLKRRLKQLKWSQRMSIAVGVAKGLEYLHSCYPPIVHKDINSSNILLSEDCIPQLSNFGAAMVKVSAHRSSYDEKAINGIGTLGYLAPEYIMYGKVDEKIDVYSFGVVLLELITGKEASSQTSSSSNQESLVLWARSLLTCGLDERLVDPNLNEEYNKDEMRTMIIVARLCLLHSSSRRPTMKTILHFLEEPNMVLGMQTKREDLQGEIGGEDENINRHSSSAVSSL